MITQHNRSDGSTRFFVDDVDFCGMTMGNLYIDRDGAGNFIPGSGTFSAESQSEQNLISLIKENISD